MKDKRANAGLLFCESRLGLMAGLAVQEMVEKTTGELCPCKVLGEGSCPLMLGRRSEAEARAV